MPLSDIFKVFSRRIAVPKRKTVKPLTEAFRIRVLMRCRESFDGSDVWDTVHNKFTYLLGRPRLTDTQTQSRALDLMAFLESCEDAHFLDFLEYAFTGSRNWHASDLVEDVNEFFRQDDLPYALTDFVWVEVPNTPHITSRLAAYPQVIRKDSDMLHEHAMEPALALLRESAYATANKEFLTALEDFRKGDLGDCLTKCGSAFESVLKVICEKHKWPYKQTDTASTLLKTVIQNAGLEPFFETPMLLLATLRNRLSSSHGAGTGSRDVTEAKAEYAVNATAAAIVFLVKHAG